MLVAEKKRLTFTSLKPTLTDGKRVVEFMNKEFGNTVSASKYLLKSDILQFQMQKPVYVDVLKRAHDLAFIKNQNMIKLVNGVIYGKNGYSRYINNLKYYMKLYKSGSCGALTNIAQAELLQKGIVAHKIKLGIVTMPITNGPIKRELRDHTFLILDMAKDSKTDNPATWGNKAVIVDPWGKIVKPAKEGLKELEQLFKFDPKKEMMLFHDANILPKEEMVKIAKINNSKRFKQDNLDEVEQNALKRLLKKIFG